MGKLDDVEKIVRMTEWNDIESWEYSENEETSQENNLAAAKRFLAAQAFLLSWQEGKVPTGWRRPRRLTDFDGKFPQSVVDTAEDVIAERITQRTYQKTARLNAALSAREKSLSEDAKDDKDLETRKKLVEALKTQFSAFNHEFFEVKSLLTAATSAVADITLRTQALSEVIE